MVRWLRWHCPPDAGFEIRALAAWGRARYLSVTEAPHNTDFHTWMGKKHFCFFQTAETGNRAPNSGVKSSGANHYPRAPAQQDSQVNSSVLITVWRVVIEVWQDSQLNSSAFSHCSVWRAAIGKGVFVIRWLILYSNNFIFKQVN